MNGSNIDWLSRNNKNGLICLVESAAPAVTDGRTTLPILYGLPSVDGQCFDMCTGHRLAIQIDDVIDNVVPAGIIRD